MSTLNKRIKFILNEVAGPVAPKDDKLNPPAKNVDKDPFEILKQVADKSDNKQYRDIYSNLVDYSLGNLENLKIDDLMMALTRFSQDAGKYGTKESIKLESKRIESIIKKDTGFFSGELLTIPEERELRNSWKTFLPQNNLEFTISASDVENAINTFDQSDKDTTLLSLTNFTLNGRFQTAPDYRFIPQKINNPIKINDTYNLHHIYLPKATKSLQYGIENKIYKKIALFSDGVEVKRVIKDEPEMAISDFIDYFLKMSVFIKGIKDKKITFNDDKFREMPYDFRRNDLVLYSGGKGVYRYIRNNNNGTSVIRNVNKSFTVKTMFLSPK